MGGGWGMKNLHADELRGAIEAVAKALSNVPVDDSPGHIGAATLAVQAAAPILRAQFTEFAVWSIAQARDRAEKAEVEQMRKQRSKSKHQFNTNIDPYRNG